MSHRAVPPGVKQMAARQGVDLGSVAGTGPDGQVTMQDVVKAAGSSQRPSGRTVTSLVQRAAAKLGVDVNALAGTGAGGRVSLADVKRAAGDRQVSQPGPITTASPVQYEPVPLQALSFGGRPATEAWLVHENDCTDAPPEVRQLASESGVRLMYLAGTGLGGRVTLADVRGEAARVQAKRRVPVEAVAATAAAEPLPAFTASGIDPRQLLQVPVPVRPAMAAAATTAEAYRILQTYSGLSDEDATWRLQLDEQVHATHGGGAGAWWNDSRNLR